MRKAGYGLKTGYGLEALLSLCVLASATYAQDDAAESRESVICKSSNEVREINTYRSAPGGAPGCRVEYIKNGANRTLWTSTTSRSYCDAKASSLVATLEADHFSCQRLQLGSNQG
jgi:hypothetical protein